MKLYIFACLCSLILWGVSCNEESAGIPTGSLFLGIERGCYIVDKGGIGCQRMNLFVSISIAAEGDTIKSYSDYIDEVKGKKIVLPVGTYTISVKIKPVGRGRMGKNRSIPVRKENNHSVR